MGLQSALTTALTGLRAAEASIDVVGNNVANSQTVGFKESSVNFATQFLQTQSIGAAPSDASGGTNPRQTGLGVKVAEITPSFTQGTIEISSNPLDVAIQGEGFLIVQGGQGGQFYTRNGQLKTNENNEVTTVTGQRVLGFNAVDGNIIEDLQPIRIPIGETAVAEATENVFLNGNLVPTAAIGDTPEIIESSILATREFEIPDPADLWTGNNINPAAAPLLNSTTSGLSGTTGVAPGVYSYKAVFVDGDGNEGAISASLSVDQNAGGDRDITLSSLPALTTPYTSINIYRTVAGGSGTGIHQFVGSTTTTSFIDSVADIGLGATLNEDAVDTAPYSYYVTFANSANNPSESRPTKQIGPIPISSGGGRIRLDAIPQPTGNTPPTPDYTDIRIYRNTEANNSTFYLVDTIPAGQTTYMDKVSDSIISNTSTPGFATLDLDGTTISTSTLLTDVQLRNNQNFTDLFQVGTLSYTGQKGDRTLEAKTLDITASSTVQDLITFI